MICACGVQFSVDHAMGCQTISTQSSFAHSQSTGVENGCQSDEFIIQRHNKNARFESRKCQGWSVMKWKYSRSFRRSLGRH